MLTSMSKVIIPRCIFFFRCIQVFTILLPSCFDFFLFCKDIIPSSSFRTLSLWVGLLVSCLMFLYISLVLFVTLFLSTSALFCWMNSVLSCLLICFCILLFRSRYSWRWISLSSPFSFTILLWSASVKTSSESQGFFLLFLLGSVFLADSSTALFISCHSSSGVDSSGSSSNRTLKRFFTSTLSCSYHIWQVFVAALYVSQLEFHGCQKKLVVWSTISSGVCLCWCKARSPSLLDQYEINLVPYGLIWGWPGVKPPWMLCEEGIKDDKMVFLAEIDQHFSPLILFP